MKAEDIRKEFNKLGRVDRKLPVDGYCLRIIMEFKNKIYIYETHSILRYIKLLNTG